MGTRVLWIKFDQISGQWIDAYKKFNSSSHAEDYDIASKIDIMALIHLIAFHSVSSQKQIFSLFIFLSFSCLITQIKPKLKIVS